MPDESANLADVLAELRAIRAVMECGPAEGLDASAAAALCGISRAKWHSLVSSGLAPESVQLGTGCCPRWMRSELLAWMRAGAPSRQQWAMMKSQTMRRAG